MPGRELVIPSIAAPDDVSLAAISRVWHLRYQGGQRHRHSRQAAEAGHELRPLITRLEARVTTGHAGLETMRPLAQAPRVLGLTLGHLPPEERLPTAAWHPTSYATSVTRNCSPPCCAWTATAIKLVDGAELAHVLAENGIEPPSAITDRGDGAGP